MALPVAMATFTSPMSAGAPAFIGGAPPSLTMAAAAAVLAAVVAAAGLASEFGFAFVAGAVDGDAAVAVDDAGAVVEAADPVAAAGDPPAEADVACVTAAITGIG